MTTQALIIRAARASDIPGLLDLYAQLTPEEVRPDLPPAEQRLEQIAAYPGSDVPIACMGATIVSTCTLIVAPNLTRGCTPYALIENVATLADWRKQGIGRAVLQGALAQAWALGCYKVMLLTGSQTPATHQFYERTGFRKTKTGFQIRREAP